MMSLEELMGERARLRDRATEALHEAAESATGGDHANAHYLAAEAMADLDRAASMHSEIGAAAVRSLTSERSPEASLYDACVRLAEACEYVREEAK